MREDTIAAIATPAAGVGGIGILRISGDRAGEILRRVFRPRGPAGPFESRRLYHGDIIDPDTNLPIDEALAALMRKPHSYTGEDVLEINCHGNPLILDAALRAVLKSGARIAEPGEFTKRAFLNNRIDLAQAEAVAELITARTERGLRQALHSLKGELSEEVRFIRASLMEVLALLETSIDFTDEDIEFPPPEDCLPQLLRAAESMEKLLATYRRGTLYRYGMTMVIAGRPNVGKSSLLNCLAEEKRAIVAAQPGTTRDLVEADIVFGNLPVRCVDTAGIREPEHDVEREGVALARRRAGEADVVLVVLDGSAGLTEDDLGIIGENSGKELLLVVNKDDLPRRLEMEELKARFPDRAVIPVSAKEHRGIDRLKENILELYGGDGDDGAGAVLTNLRHREALEKARTGVDAARRCIEEAASPELTAFEVREALRHLSLITGEGAGEELLDLIFSRFCIGK